MKKGFLCFVVLLSVVGGRAQVIPHVGLQKSAAVSNNNSASTIGSAGNVDKTTLMGFDRWYNYVNYLRYSGDSMHWQSTYVNLWNDTTAIFATSDSTYHYNDLTSIGVCFDPFARGFDNDTLYDREICVTSSDAYTIDSISIFGKYMRNNARTSPVDTIRVAIVYGNGSLSSDIPIGQFTDSGSHTNFPYSEYGVDTIWWAGLKHDSLANRADSQGGGRAPVVFDTYLDSSDTASFFQRSVGLPAPLIVPPAGSFGANVVSVSLSFKCGDATYPYDDTVLYGNGSYKRGEFSPLIVFKGINDSMPVFPTYLHYDFNTGYFKKEGVADSGWGDIYMPNWAIINAGHTASKLQYPAIGVHLTCWTCGSVSWFGCDPGKIASQSPSINNSIKINPNPANDELQLSYSFLSPSHLQVVLTNTLGQVVATEDLENVNTGMVDFNTSSLSPGVYFYFVWANGFEQSGKVVVVH